MTIRKKTKSSSTSSRQETNSSEKHVDVFHPKTKTPAKLPTNTPAKTLVKKVVENASENAGENASENAGESASENACENIGENAGENVGENASGRPYAVNACPCAAGSFPSSPIGRLRNHNSCLCSQNPRSCRPNDHPCNPNDLPFWPGLPQTILLQFQIRF